MRNLDLLYDLYTPVRKLNERTLTGSQVIKDPALSETEF